MRSATLASVRDYVAACICCHPNLARSLSEQAHRDPDEQCATHPPDASRSLPQRTAFLQGMGVGRTHLLLTLLFLSVLLRGALLATAAACCFLLLSATGEATEAQCRSSRYG